MRASNSPPWEREQEEVGAETQRRGGTWERPEGGGKRAGGRGSRGHTWVQNPKERREGVRNGGLLSQGMNGCGEQGLMTLGHGEVGEKGLPRGEYQPQGPLITGEVCLQEDRSRWKGPSVRWAGRGGRPPPRL